MSPQTEVAEPLSPPPRDPVGGHVEEFIGRHQTGDEATPEQFAAGCPERYRREVESRCREYLANLSVLRTPSGVGAGGAGGPPRPATPARVGPYRIGERLGVGGMAVVHRAVHVATGRQVAIKILHEHVSASRIELRRFELECELGARFDHPHIVGVADFGEDRGVHYLVLSDVMVGSVADRLPARDRAPGAAAGAAGSPGSTVLEVAAPSPPPQASGGERITRAIDVCRDVLRALEYLHELKVVHRDVKPRNILLDCDGRAKLADFGLARFEDVSHGFTRTGHAVGTVAYMSPEQALAKRRGVDHCADLYSLGVVLYEMLTLRRPFDGTTEEVLSQIAFAVPVPPSRRNPQVPTDLETVCLKAMEKAPEHRYQHAREMLEDLERVRRLEAPRAIPPSRWQRAWRRMHRHRASVASALAASVLTVVALVWIHEAQRRAARLEAMPKLTVVTDEPGATVSLRPLIVETGEFGPPRELGTTPLRAVPIDEGFYRIVVAEPDGFAELSRWIIRHGEGERPGADGVFVHRIEPTIRPTAAVADATAMARIDDPAPFVSGQNPGSRLLPREVVTVAPFWIDRHEVTNRDYKEFVDVAGVPAGDWPALWQERGRYERDWDDLPVVGVTYAEARDYAEWRGKRLPTRREWDRAARSTDGRAYPWGDEPGAWRERACVGRGPAGMAWGTGFAEYLAHAAPVGSHEDDRSPDGLYDVLGNVRELVDGVAVARYGARLHPEYPSRFVRGFSWTYRDRPPELLSIGKVPADHVIADANVGFRCAKSELAK